MTKITMSLTISELEEERAKILNEIESKAKKLSTSGSTEDESLSLNDWLTAAEDVMPEKNQPNPTPKYSKKMISTSNIQNKTSFFGVVIMLTLFLTILGVIYIAYTSIHKELQNVLAVKEKHIEQMQQLQTDMQALQESVASGGKSALFSQLEAKVASLELQVTELKEQVISQKPTLATVSNDSGLENKGVKTNESASDILVSTEESKTNNNSLITEAI